MEDSNSELDFFRQKWKEEVSARSKSELKASPSSRPAQSTPKPPLSRRLAVDRAERRDKAHDEDLEHHGPEHLADSPSIDLGETSTTTSTKVPESALEHYERAVERESQGSLGDSLTHYRRAFKLDHRVDQKYKDKHFPASSLATKPANPNLSNAAVAIPGTAHHSLRGPPQVYQTLITGFAGLSIEPAPPEIEGSKPAPCYLADLPEEILVGILQEVAILDVSSFVRLAQVCKKMAYMVATEEQIWRRICTGAEVGFGAMHYAWNCEINGERIIEPTDEIYEHEATSSLIARSLTKSAITLSLLQSVYAASWQRMFRTRPRIRFNGCYISYVNYMRPGVASPSQVSWSTPVHIITYYRYLRFFRDGTVISLQTTSEPTDVVQHLTKELVATHRDGANPHLPSVVMQNALRGRWRLSTSIDNPSADLKDSEGDVLVDTEAPYPKYVFRMELSMGSSGKGARNNKLSWKGFWYYNKLTEDLEEFTLRNDRAFIWSRVKRYGDGV